MIQSYSAYEIPGKSPVAWGETTDANAGMTQMLGLSDEDFI